MAESEDVNTLKRRGRRRLVGAIALVLAAVIVLPMVFDSEPRGGAPQVSVRIPAEDETGFAPKVTPKLPAVQETKPAEKAAEKAPEKAAEKAPEKAAPLPADRATAEAGDKERAERALAGEQYVVQVGAFGDPEKIREVTGKLAAAKIPFYTEPIAVKSGMLTRVRAGPYASRDAADRTQKQLKDLGLKPGNVVAKS